MKIYTRTGDSGDTSLYGGARRSKADLRVTAYGEIDELQAHLGLSRALLDKKEQDISVQLLAIQNDCFTLSSELARLESKADRKDPDLALDRVAWLEDRIDELEKNLRPLKAFILQDGCQPAAQLFVTRAVSRRAERAVVLLHQKEPVSRILLTYLNRLSDYLFVVARTCNHRAGIPEEEWHGRETTA